MSDKQYYDPDPTEEQLARMLEERAIHKAAGLAMIGRRCESAVMLENRGLMMSSRSALDDGQLTNANWDVFPDDPKYLELCKRFNVQKPGDIGSIEYRSVDGRWMNVLTKQFEDPD